MNLPETSRKLKAAARRFRALLWSLLALYGVEIVLKLVSIRLIAAGAPGDTGTLHEAGLWVDTASVVLFVAMMVLPVAIFFYGRRHAGALRAETGTALLWQIYQVLFWIVVVATILLGITVAFLVTHIRPVR